MAETDILNPQKGYSSAINDNPNPSYGFTRKTNANSVLSRARLGGWNQRDTANSGYAFALGYIDRPWSTMLWLKRFYEIGKGGYFTYIDYDGGGRHHVGRFTSEPNPVQNSNGKYTCQELVFEEIPQCRMLTYPSDFADWSRTINVIDDNLRANVGFQGAWSLQQDPYRFGADSTSAPVSYQLANLSPAASDFAQMQYTGWGWQMNFLGTPLASLGVSTTPAAQGVCDIYVDGALKVQGLDLYAGTATALYGYLPVGGITALAPPTLAATPSGRAVASGGSTVSIPQITISMPQMPLDAHRVKIVARASKSSGASNTGVYYPQLQVMV